MNREVYQRLREIARECNVIVVTATQAAPGGGLCRSHFEPNDVIIIDYLDIIRPMDAVCSPQ